MVQGLKAASDSLPGSFPFDRDQAHSANTDYKVYGLVIGGRLLQAIAIAVVPASLVGIVLLGPVGILGLITAVAFFSLGTHLSEKASKDPSVEGEQRPAQRPAQCRSIGGESRRRRNKSERKIGVPLASVNSPKPPVISSTVPESSVDQTSPPPSAPIVSVNSPKPPVTSPTVPQSSADQTNPPPSVLLAPVRSNAPAGGTRPNGTRKGAASVSAGKRPLQRRRRLTTTSQSATAWALLGASQPRHPAFALPQQPPYEQGQPIGLRNRSNNCWANAGLQIVLNSEALSGCEAVQGQEVFRGVIQNYREAQAREGAGDRRLAGEVSQRVRIELHQKGPVLDGISSSPDVSEDAVVLFEHLFTGAPKPLSVLHSFRGGQLSTDRTEPLIQLPLAGDQQIDFDVLFESFFNYETAGIATTLQYDKAPDHLLLQLHRFTQEGVKNSAEVKVPEQLNLSGNHCIDGKDARYQCRGFIVHTGVRIGGGHYVAYVKRPDGSWWLCDDGTTRMVSQEQVNYWISRGYIYHFEKIDRS